MKKIINAVERYILKNWIWIVVGCVLTRKAVETAYETRGVYRIGGEWLILPIILMLVSLVRSMRSEYKRYKR